MLKSEKTPNILKVSLHGMDIEMQRMMALYLKFPCNGIAVIVDDKDAQAEIIDLDLSNSKTLLKARTSQKPSKPVIALSMADITSFSNAIYVKKPIKLPEIIKALNKAKDNVQKTAVQTKGNKLSTLNNKQRSKINSALNSENTSAIIYTPSKSNTLHAKKYTRNTIRYSFNGMTAALKNRSILGFNNRTPIPVEILNLSSKGALIQLKKPHKINNKVILKIQFGINHIFSFQAHVVRKKNITIGIKFLEYQYDLCDELVSSGLGFNFD